MFTGIVVATGSIAALASQGADTRVRVMTGKLDLSKVHVGDSIAVTGVCLTVTACESDGCWFDVSAETLSCTTLAELAVGARVNLEPALTLATPLGGHLVSGHVDGIGTVRERRSEGRSIRFTIEAPPELAKYIAAKGSICVDGVSLTVNAVRGAVFELNIVPHTLQETTLGDYQVDQRVNLEVDLIARYLERLLLGESAAHHPGSITRAFLAEHGFPNS